MSLHVVLFGPVACLAGENDELAYDVGAAEVDAGVGLREAFLLGQADGLRQGAVGGERVEDEVDGSAQHGLNLQDAVAGVAQVVDGADDGQSGAHIGLKAIDDATLQRRVLQSDIALIV